MKTNLSLYIAKIRRHRAFLEVDMMVGLAILALAILPFGYSVVKERQALRIAYCRIVAVEIVDGEMEILAAGDWENFPDGAQTYPVHANAAAQLPAGRFGLTKTGKHLRLEWASDEHRGIGVVVREVTVK